MEPEILIVDEVLAVGDAAFQKKCPCKMNDEAKGGRSVMFVNHNMATIQSLCSRSILLLDGQGYTNSNTQEVVDEYLKFRDNLTKVYIKSRKDRRA